MKVTALIVAAATVASATPNVNLEVLQAFKEFQTRFGKTYANDEVPTRLKIFATNLKRVQALNMEHVKMGGADNVHGVTKFMDLSKDEFKSMYLNYIPNNANTTRTPVKTMGAPADAVDWRTKGAVTAVKDQGQCGSCWAFSATEAIESYRFLNDGKLHELSPQQINSCDKVDQGCNGGNTEYAYEYVVKAGGVQLEKDYPYTSGRGSTGSCKFDSTKVDTIISGYTSIETGEDNLEKALNNGPVSVCLAADAFQTYSSGVLTRCPGSIDHCVQAVGYTADYWIVRNSWAADWGEEGFIRLKRGSDLCHVSQDATFPTFPNPPEPTPAPAPTPPTPAPAPTPEPAPTPAADTCESALESECGDEQSNPVDCLVCAWESDKVSDICDDGEIDDFCGL